MARLHEIFDLQMGKTPARANSDYWDDGTNDWVSIADLSGYEKYVGGTKEQITDKAVQESGVKAVPPNTVIMSFKLSLGKTAITRDAVYTNEAIMAFIPKGIYQILPEYLFYMLSSRDWSNGTNRAVMGATLNKATLGDIDIIIPPFNEQCQMAAVLDKLSNLISLRKQQLTKLDELIKSQFIEMFGDLASPACSWTQLKLVEACDDSDDIKCGPFGTQLNKDEYQYEGVALWEIPQINAQFKIEPTHYLHPNKAAELDAYSIIPGDIAMSRKGNVGRCAVFPFDYAPGVIHSDVLRIRVDTKKVMPIFMMYQLRYSGFVKRQIEQVSAGAIMAGINVTKLKSILVHLPPIDLQSQFTAFVEQTDKSKLTIQQSLDKLEMLKKSLMQQYFG